VNVLLDPTAHPVIAHRGDSAHFPENTLEAFEGAVDAGADALELDVRLSRDDEVMVIHDGTVDRTTDGTGQVADLTSAELQRLDAGARFTVDGGRSHPFAGRGVRIPTLREVLALDSEVPLLIEVKVAEAAVATLRLLEERGALDRAVLGSFDARSMRLARDRAVCTTASSRDVAWLLCRLATVRPRTLPYEVLSIPFTYRGVPLPIRAIASAARRAGVIVHVWTIDEPQAAERLWRTGVSGIVTNEPGPLRALRDRLFGEGGGNR
jgi:glycerophosphoryl diester phosphodiesterase